ncbi:unnamed protein product [Heterobilharzia americana]|nr:unnamed protein product [Heterobilharzia americana]
MFFTHRKNNHAEKQKLINEQFLDMIYKINATRLPVSAFTLCATYFEDVVEKLNIYSPSVTYFYNGGQYKFEFKETMRVNQYGANSMYEWIRRKVGSPIKLLRNLHETKELISKNKLIVIMFMKEANEKIMKNYSYVSEQVDHIAYGLVYEKIIHDNFGITNQSLLMIRKESEDTEPSDLIYSGNWDIESLGSFLLIESSPYVSEFQPSELTYFDSSIIRFNAYLFLLQSDPEFSQVINTYQKACKLFRPKIRCYFVNMAKKANLVFAKQQGVHMGYGYPRFHLVATSLTKPSLHYRLRGGKFEFGQKNFHDPDLMNLIKTQEITTFFNKLLQHKLSPFYISEVIPEDYDDFSEYENLAHIPVTDTQKTSPNKLRFVSKIVGATFKRLAKNSDWTSVVYFTAKWCIGCNRTIYEHFTKLAQYYHKLGREDLLFGYSNYEINEYEGLKAAKMPRIKIFPKESQDEIDFDGVESFNDIKDFIETSGVKFISYEVNFLSNLIHEFPLFMNNI